MMTICMGRRSPRFGVGHCMIEDYLQDSRGNEGKNYRSTYIINKIVNKFS